MLPYVVQTENGLADKHEKGRIYTKKKKRYHKNITSWRDKCHVSGFDCSIHQRVVTFAKIGVTCLS